VSVLASGGLPLRERGSLLIAVLFMLLAATILGLSAMHATGLEMQMSSNSREQLMLQEAAEFAVAQIAQEIHTLGGFSNNSLANHECDDLCFDENCSGGYCFSGAGASDPSSWKTCATGLPVAEPSQTPAIWSDASGRHNSVAIPDAEISAKYTIEFRCYATADDALAMDDANNTKVFRITTLVSSKSGRSTMLLRVTIKDV
jgi:Tfp pilus assembly protein PilX